MIKVTEHRCYFVGSFLALVLAIAHPAVADDHTSIIAPLVRQSLLLDITAYKSRMIAVGERGHVLVSDNSGDDWRQVQVPTRSTLTAVYLLDERHAWAVGHDAVILRSKDGGNSWQRVFFDPEQERPLLDVWFADARHGIAIGAYGFFLETSNGGESWRERMIAEEDYHLNRIASADDGRLYIAGEAGHLYVSHDHGQQWESLPSPYRGSFFSILAPDLQHLLIGGLRGHLYLSEDGGQNWQPLPSRSTDMLTDAVQLDDGRVVIVGLDGAVILYTSPEELSYHFRSDRKAITGVEVNDRGELMAVGAGGLVRIHPDEPVDNGAME